MKRRIHRIAAFGIACVLAFPEPGFAADNRGYALLGAAETQSTITTVTVDAKADKIEVSGTCEESVVAVAVQIRDSQNSIVAMETFPAGNGVYEASLDITLAQGDYKVYVADYNGGKWKTGEFSIGQSSGGSTGGGDSTGSGDSSNGSSDSKGEGDSTDGSTKPSEDTTPDTKPDDTQTETIIIKENGKLNGALVKTTLSSESIAKKLEASGNKTGDVVIAVKTGKKSYTVQMAVEALEPGNRLKVMQLDKKTGKYVLVNAKTYTVTKDGKLSLSLTAGKDYALVDEKEASAVEAAILKTAKLKKTSAKLARGKKLSVQLSSKFNMENVQKITYSTNKKSVATVSKNGKIAARKKGAATIQVTVKLKNGKTKKLTMKVKVV